MEPTPGQPPATPPAAPGAEGRPQGQDTTGGPRPTQPQPRPYERVITRDAKTQTGLFKVHRISERLYFEIPTGTLDRDMLLVTRAAAGSALGGNRVLRWQRAGNRVYLRQQSYQIVADTALPIFRAVEAMTVGSIIASFNVETYGPDSASVIEVTRLYTTNVTEFAGINGIVPDRTFIENVAAYPENIEIEATQTGTATPAPAAPGVTPPPGARPLTTTVRVHWSMLRLPETPMMPRLHDARVGFINTSVLDYGRPEHEAVTRRYIHRFRLEKKEPQAEVSEPVKPIVFWIDPATPSWLVPWVRSGIEAWLPAFEEAGFRNAIVARTAPSEEEDSSWSIHDARHSMVYWRPSTVANATGGQTVDPRSGEIIKAEVGMFHNIMQLMQDWYFIQASAIDARARGLPLPDSLMGRLVQNVVSHEVGHAIGFPHNMKSSSMYPADSIRSASFIRRMGGHAASVMDYSRFNYVAQPEDNIPLEYVIPNVGPYDRFAVMWGHKPVPGARTADDEKPTLDRWARAQDSVPWFRFSTTGATNDPGDLTEAVGDADAVKSTTYALRNLERVMSLMVPAAEKPGQDYSLLGRLYGEAVTQWSRYMGHVAAVIGSAESQERYGTGVRFRPLSRERQREAVAFLSRHAFRVPRYFTNPEVLRRIESEGTVGRIRSAQTSVLNSLLGERRLNRLIEYEALARRPADAYTVGDLLGDVRQAIWGELVGSRVHIDVYRRNLQRAYLETVERQVNPARAAPISTPIIVSLEIPIFPSVPAFASDARPIMRGELIELRRQADTAIGRAADNITRLHLRDVVYQIDRILDPPRTDEYTERFT